MALDLKKLEQMKAADTRRQTSFVPRRAVTAQPVKPVAVAPMTKKAGLPKPVVKSVAAPVQGGKNLFDWMPPPIEGLSSNALTNSLMSYNPNNSSIPGVENQPFSTAGSLMPVIAGAVPQTIIPPQVNSKDSSLWGGVKDFFGFGDSKTPGVTGNTFSFSPMDGLKDVFKDASKWAQDAGMFDSTKDGVTTQGWAAPVMGGIKGIADSYMALEMYGLYKDSLENSKQQFAQNFGAQAKAVNTRLADRQAARHGNDPTRYASVQDYMAKNGV